MNVLDLISRLDKAKQTTSDQWVARCPVHQDRLPSLSIRDAGDRILLHCFAGCSTQDVLAAIGMSFADVLPERAPDAVQTRMPWNPRTVLEAVAHDALAVAFYAEEMSRRPLTDTEKDDLWDRASAIGEAINYVRSR